MWCLVHQLFLVCKKQLVNKDIKCNEMSFCEMSMQQVIDIILPLSSKQPRIAYIGKIEARLKVP